MPAACLPAGRSRQRRRAERQDCAPARAEGSSTSSILLHHRTSTPAPTTTTRRRVSHPAIPPSPGLPTASHRRARPPPSPSFAAHRARQCHSRPPRAPQPCFHSPARRAPSARGSACDPVIAPCSPPTSAPDCCPALPCPAHRSAPRRPRRPRPGQTSLAPARLSSIHHAQLHAPSYPASVSLSAATARPRFPSRRPGARRAGAAKAPQGCSTLDVACPASS